MNCKSPIFHTIERSGGEAGVQYHVGWQKCNLEILGFNTQFLEDAFKKLRDDGGQIHGKPSLTTTKSARKGWKASEVGSLDEARQQVQAKAGQCRGQCRLVDHLIKHAKTAIHSNP